MTKKPDAILFDWDGTLVNTMDGIRAYNNMTRNHFGLPDLTDDDFKELMKYSARDYFAKIFPDQAEEAAKIHRQFVLDHHLNYIELMPHAEPFLMHVKNLGIRMGVVSNKQQLTLEKEIAHYGWADYFETTIGAGRAERDKPAADPILLAANELNLGTSNIWYVGDTVTDMKAATAAKCIPIFIEHGFDETHEILSYNPHLIVRDLIDLQSKLA